MDKAIISFFFVCITFVSCECEHHEQFFPLSTEQKLWFSELNHDSIVKCKSSNGFSEEYKIYNKFNGKGQRWTNGGCSEIQICEITTIQYYSSLATYTFDFEYSTIKSIPEFKAEIRMGSKEYSTLNFKFPLDQYDQLSYFFYYPYKETQSKGFRKVGDSIINQKIYDDVYQFDLEINITNPLHITNLVLSKKKGIIAFQTQNGVIWNME